MGRAEISPGVGVAVINPLPIMLLRFDFRAFDSLGNMPSLINHDGPLEFDDHGSILFEARGFEAHNPDIRSGLRLSLLENLTLRIQRIAHRRADSAGALHPSPNWPSHFEKCRRPIGR